MNDNPDLAAQLLQVLTELARVLGDLFLVLGRVVVAWALLIVWIAWWLWGVNWKRVWPVLARGAWAPLLLLLVIVALVWSQIAPAVRLPNFWWQLGALILLLLLTLFCGWLQGVFNWAPAEIDLEPPPTHTHNGAHVHH